MRTKKPNASDDYRRIRSSLMVKGYTIASFARQYGYNQQTVYHAAKGLRYGIKSAAILEKLKEVARG
jgi:hypothetical protein